MGGLWPGRKRRIWPVLGLLGLVGGAGDDYGRDAVSLYEGFRLPSHDDPHWAWPLKLLPIAYLGCGMYYCVDCGTKDALVTLFEPNPHERGKPWDDSFFPFGVSLVELLKLWVDGHGEEDLFKAAWLAKHPGETWNDGF